MLALVAIAAVSFLCCSESWALVIGISKYADPAVVPLHFAATDAQQVGRAFVEHCAVPEENLTVLLDEAATREAILAALHHINQLAGPLDDILLYIAGHGTITADLDGDEADGDRLDEALLVFDSFACDPQSFLLDDALGAWMEQTNVRSVAVFFDACHSGGQSRTLDTPATPHSTDVSAIADSMARDLITSVTQTSRGVLAACGSREMAYESRGLGHGVFTHFLLQAICDQTSDLNGDGAVFLDELGCVVIESVMAWSRMRSETQTPVLDQVSSQEILIIPPPKDPTALVSPLASTAMSPAEGFVGFSEPAPIPLAADIEDGARRFRFPPRFEDGVKKTILLGGIAPMEDRWVTADPVSGYVYTVSGDGLGQTLGRIPEPLADFTIQGGVLYGCFLPEENTLVTYDLYEGLAANTLRLTDSLPLDRAQLTGVSVAGSTLSLIGWSGGTQTLVVYDLHNDCLTLAAPIAGRGCVGLQEHEGALYSLDARHGFLVRLEKSDDQPEIGLIFVTDLNVYVPDGWLPYDPRGEHESLAGFYFTDNHLLLSACVSAGVEQAGLFEISLDAPLVPACIPITNSPDAVSPLEITSP